MALISLQEAKSLGLLDETMYPELFGGGRFPGNFGSTAPFFRLPGLTGLRQPRFGLEPLLLRLGLSPQRSAFTGGPGAVPVGRASARRGELTPEQQLEIVRRQVEEGIIDPRGLPAEVRAALARSLPAARTAFSAIRSSLPATAVPPGLPGGVQELALAQRALGNASTLNALLTTQGPAGLSPEVQEALQAQRTGERADLSNAAALFAEPPFTPEVPGAVGGPGAFGARVLEEGGAQGLRTLGTPTGPPEFAPGIPTAPLTPEALQLGQQAETADLTQPGLMDLLQGTGPALAGLSTAGGLASAGMAFANKRPGPGILSLASTAGGVGALVKRFPWLFDTQEWARMVGLEPAAATVAQAAPAIMTAAGPLAAEAAPALAEAAPSIMTAAGPAAAEGGAEAAADVAGSGFDAAGLLQGIGSAAGLANIGLDISRGDPVGALRNSIVLGSQFLGPEVGIPVAIGNALISLFTGGKEKKQKPDNPEFPRVSGEARAFASQLAQAPTLDDLYKDIVAHQSGSVGGTSGQADIIRLVGGPGRSQYYPFDPADKQAAVDRGDIVLPTGYKTISEYAEAKGHNLPGVPVFFGNPNDTYPVYSRDYGLKLLQTPDAAQYLRGAVQAGVSPGLLEPLNAQLGRTVQERLIALGMPPGAAPGLAASIAALPPPPPEPVEGKILQPQPPPEAGA